MSTIRDDAERYRKLHYMGTIEAARFIEKYGFVALDRALDKFKTDRVQFKRAMELRSNPVLTRT
jgi:hypothetical protein